MNDSHGTTAPIQWMGHIVSEWDEQRLFLKTLIVGSTSQVYTTPEHLAAAGYVPIARLEAVQDKLNHAEAECETLRPLAEQWINSKPKASKRPSAKRSNTNGN